MTIINNSIEQSEAINTEVGVLSGRDCIYITTVTLDEKNNLIFKGKLNGELLSNYDGEKEYLTYTLTFNNSISHFACELDTYENLNNIFHDVYNSSFDIIKNSNLLKNFPIRSDYDKSKYKHFRVFTYDVVYNIIAVDFKFEINQEA